MAFFVNCLYSEPDDTNGRASTILLVHRAEGVNGSRIHFGTDFGRNVVTVSVT